MKRHRGERGREREREREGEDDGLDAYAEEVVIEKIKKIRDMGLAHGSLSRLRQELESAVEVILVDRRNNAAAGIVLSPSEETDRLRRCTAILEHATAQWEQLGFNADSLKQIITDMSVFAETVQQSYIQVRSDTSEALANEHENARILKQNDDGTFILRPPQTHEVLFRFLPEYQMCLRQLVNLKNHKLSLIPEIKRRHKLNTQLFNNAVFVRELIHEICTAPIIASKFASTHFAAVRAFTAAASDFNFVMRTASADYETELHDCGIRACIDTCEKINEEMQKIFEPIINPVQAALTAGGRHKKTR